MNIGQKPLKTVDEYRHNIKLLKYHLKKEKKNNQTLKYRQAKSIKNRKSFLKQENQRIYSLSNTVKSLNLRLKDMGLIIADLFRMVDSSYQGEITKEQFIKTISLVKSGIQDTCFTQMFYAIDTSLNGNIMSYLGLISEEQFDQFICAYGGSNSKQVLQYQKKALNRFGAMLKRKNQQPSQFIENMKDPISVYEFSNSLQQIGLSNNEVMILLKYFDPSRTGNIRHEMFLKMMQNLKFKNEKQLENEAYEKGLQQFCVKLRQMSINPITLYEQADVDGSEGVSSLELQQAFKKLLPEETAFQIKKWVKLINLNNDNEITKQQYTSSIRCFYSLDQLNKFSSLYEKGHPNLKKINNQEIPIEKIMMELADKIQDSGMTKKEVFDFIDFSKNGTLDKEEMVDGLKGLGMHVGFIGRVMSVFDRDCSGQIDLEQWLHLLGQDVEMSEVGLPDDLEADQVQGEGNRIFTKNSKKVGQQKKRIQNKNTIKSKENKIKQPNKTIKNTTKQQKQTISKPVSNNRTQPQVKTRIKEQSVEKNKISSNKQTVTTHKNSQKEQSKKKKQSKVQPPKMKENKKMKFLEDETHHIDDNQNQFQQDQPINTENIETEIAIKYKKSKIKVINYFKQMDHKNLKYLSERDFYQSINLMGLRVTQQQKRQIFMKYCVDGGIIRYIQFLQQLINMYAVDVEEEQEEQEEQENKNDKKKQEQQHGQKKQDKNHGKEKYEKSKQQNQKRPIQLMKNLSKQSVSQIQHQQQEQQIVAEQQQCNRQVAENRTAKPKRTNPMPILSDLTMMHSVFNEVIKRGKEVQGFKELLKLSIKGGEHTQTGYKLSHYINCEQQLTKLKQKYLITANSLKKNNKLFKDRQFPAQCSSLTKQPNKSTIAQVQMLRWKHYSELYSNPRLFSGGVQPNDIRQGSLGDCYLLCSLSCLAEYTNLIQRLFQYFDMEHGYFLIWLCVDGQWKLVEIDGYIPTNPAGTQPAFSRTQSQELWVLLLQKAYAKVYGDYQKIAGGQPYQAIKDLSGGPGQSFTHSTVPKQEIWSKLKHANQQQFLMTCGTQMKNDRTVKIQGHSESITREGIVLGHAYSILDLQQIKNQKIVQLRNPWGQIEWKGDWSDKSNKWTPQLKRKFNYDGNQMDGIFWMPFDTFYSQYNTTAINYIRPNYYYDSLKQTNIKTVIAKTDPNSFQHGYFMVSQKDHRHQGLPPNTPYSLCHIIGLIYNQNTGKVVKKVADHKYLYQRQASVEFDGLKPDEQAVVIISLQRSASIVVGYYGDKQTQFSIQNDCLPYMQGLAALGEYDEGMNEQKGVMRTWMIGIGDVVFLCFKNISTELYTLQITTQKPQNIKIIPPQSSKNALKMQPGQMKTIKGKLIDIKKGYSFGSMGISKLT